MNLLNNVKTSIKGKGIRIVFPDGHEPSVLKAGSLLYHQKLAIPYFVGHRTTIDEICKKNNISTEGFNIRDPYFDDNTDRFITHYQELRKHKGISLEDARRSIVQSHFFSAMLLKHHMVDGVVSGFNNTTKPFLPAFHIIGLKDVAKASSYFIMIKGTLNAFFSDCGLIIDPTESDLADIALSTAKSAELFGISPKIAMLSFSTKGSAKHPLVEKVKNATTLVNRKHPELVVDGELQFDAATVPSIAEKKGSSIKGDANVFIFPNLDAGNIAYKITERWGKFKAIGPLLQGLNQPVNDMSRGASVQDIVNIACITAYEAMNTK